MLPFFESLFKVRFFYLAEDSYLITLVLLGVVLIAALLFLNKKILFGILVSLSCFGVLGMYSFINHSEIVSFTVSHDSGEQTYYAVCRNPLMSVEMDSFIIYKPVVGGIIGNDIYHGSIRRRPESLSGHISADADGNKIRVYIDGNLMDGYDSDEYTFIAE